MDEVLAAVIQLYQSVITNIFHTVALFQEIFDPALKSKKH